MVEDYEKWFAQDCCACDRPLRDGGEHINWVVLDKRADWDSPAAGNVAYDIPQEYAMALVCDACVDDDADPAYALKGDDLERVAVDDLEDLPSMGDRIGGDHEH